MEETVYAVELRKLMAKKKRQSAEFRFYEMPQNEPVLALMGEKWIQEYGKDINNQHFHNLLEIGYCHYGEGDLHIEDSSYRFSEDMIACIPPNVLHVTKSDTDVKAFWEYIYIDPEKVLKRFGKSGQEIKSLTDMINQKSFFIKSEENPIIKTLVGAIFKEMQYKEKYYTECIWGIVYSLIFEIVRFNGINSEMFPVRNTGLQLEKAIAFVEKNFANDFKIIDIANECHMSETHFRRIFQEKMNMTPVEYINFVRVKKACELIDKTDISMEDIAQRVGFVTPYTFNRNFRRIIGTSPYQWKKRPDNHEGKLLEYKISALKGW